MTKIEPLPGMKRGSLLHGSMRGRPLIIMGNSWSLNSMDLDKVFAFKTLGCNRAMQMERHPDYYTVVDRDAYRRELGRIRAYKGTRILSRTLFDKKVSCRRVPIQDIPEFEWYGFHAVSTSCPVPTSWRYVVTTVSNDRNVLRKEVIPSVCDNLDVFMPSGANIGYCMLQIAVALGASPIGVCGIDLEWKSTAKSHFFGNGRSQGCFRFNTRRILRFFSAAAMWCAEKGIEIYNLSPEGVLNCYPRMSEHEFHGRFAQYRDGDLLYPRKQFEPGLGEPGGPGRIWHTHYRGKPNPADFSPLVSAFSRSGGPIRGIDQAQRRKAEVARLARATRLARLARRKAGG